MTSGALTDSLRETLALFGGEASRPPLTSTEVAERLDVGRRSAYERLVRLADRGLLESKKVGASGRVWWRSAEPGRTDSVSVDSVSADPVLAAPASSETGSGDATRPVRVESVGSLVSDVLAGVDVGIFVLDDGLDVAWINDATERYFGLDRERVVGRDKRELVEERIAPIVDDSAAFAETVLSTYDDNTAEQFECRVTPGDHRDERWLEHRSKPIESGAYAGGRVEIYYDVTDRKRARRARRESREELRRERDLLERVMEAAPVGISVLTPDAGIERANSRALELRGLSGAGPTDLSAGDRTLRTESGEPVPFEERPFARARDETEQVRDWVGRLELPDGARRWLSVNATPITNEAGEVERVVTTADDITRFKEQAERLRRQRDELVSELDEVFERIDDGVLALDRERRFTYVNERASELLGRSPDELLGEHIWGVLEPGPKAEAAFDEALATQESVSFEEFYEPPESWFENHVYPSESGLSVYFRDVTDRKTRERELEESERRYRTLADHFPNGAVVMFDDDLRYTLIAGEIPDRLDADTDEWVGRPVGEVVPSEARDAFVEHYRAALAGEASTFETELEGRILQVRAVPIRDEDGEVFAGMGMSQDVTERKERERELERQRTRLAAVNDLNAVVRDITDAVIDQSSRDRIEEIVCERLADSESYLFAWIGDVDVQTQTVNLRAEAGVEGYLDGVTLSVDPDDERSDGPTGRALLRREVQTTQDIRTDSRHDPWREHVEEYGFRSSAAIPIVHEDTLFGVLNVYAERPNAFTGDERSVIGRLGEVVGHAIAAVERKRALMSDEVVELEFQIDGVFEAFDASTSADSRITFDRAVPAGDDAYLEYGTATGDAMDALEALVDAGAYAHWEEVNVLRNDGERTHFELRMSEPPVISAVATHGGYVDEAAIEDGDYYLRVHLPPETDVRRVIERITSGYPAARIVTRRQVTRDRESVSAFERTLHERLTDRQRTAIEAAHYAGYFRWPRTSTGEEVAASIGVSPPTFHYHLRKAQQTLVSAVLDGGGSPPSR